MSITDGHPEPRRSRPHPLAATLPRRRFLALGAGLLAAPTVAACASRAPSATPIGPTSPLVASAEQARQRSGAKVVTAQLTASPTTIDLGGVAVQTWAFNSQLPGPEIRLARGEVLRAELRNGLPQPSTIHWHGVALRNDMDGVPGLTQAPVAPQNTFTYDFTAPDAGTYWMHPHVGMQFDRGLYAPVVVTDPGDPGNYDVEAVIVVDDWLDGVAGDPDQRLEQLRKNGMAMGSMAMGSMAMGGPSDPTNPLGPDTGDVKDYPYYLINGRISTDPVTVAAKPGQRLKLRIINAGADTAFRVALGGHRLTITDSDGFPVNPTDTSSVLMGMGERYDALVTLGDGVFPLVANAEGKQGHAMAVVRTGAGSTPGRARRCPADRCPAHLDRGGAAEHPGARPHLRPRAGDGPVGLPLDDQRQDLRRAHPARRRPGRAGSAAVRQPDRDAAPDAPARTHLSGGQRCGHRPAQGHLDRVTRADGGGRPAGRQPRPVVAALPQPLSR